MSTIAARWFVVVAAIALAACSGRRPSEFASNDGFEIDCRDTPCPWAIVRGDAHLGDGWTQGDVALDLSGDTDDVAELRTVLLDPSTRQLVLESAILRESAVDLQLQLDWYAPGQGVGKSFWDRAPVLLDHHVMPIWEKNVSRIQRLVDVPSESVAVILRVVKSGSGRALVDEVTLGRTPATIDGVPQ